MTKYFAMKAQKDILGFDHPYGASKIFKLNSNSSCELKSAYMFGPTLDEISHCVTSKKYKKIRRNKKGRRIREMFVPQLCAPKKYRYKSEDLEKVSFNVVVSFF